MVEKIGLFFGSFNPVHNGHLMLAQYCLTHCELDSICFVLSPQNPFKESKDLLSFEDRFNMLYVLLENEEQNMKVVDWEKHLGLPSYTHRTMKHLADNNDGTKEYYIILGADVFSTIDTWEYYDELLKYDLIIYPRLNLNGEDDKELYENTLKRLNKGVLKTHYLENAPLCSLSSTFVRNEIKHGVELKYYVPPIVSELIKEKKYYT